MLKIIVFLFLWKVVGPASWISRPSQGNECSPSLWAGVLWSPPSHGPGSSSCIVQLNWVPNCLKAPIRPSLLVTHFPIFPGFPSGWGIFFFQSQCWKLYCAEKRTRPGMSPTSHQGTYSPSISPSSLLASVCTPMQAPSVRLEGRWTRGPS